MFTDVWCMYFLRLVVPSEDAQNKDTGSFTQAMLMKISDIVVKAKVV